MNIYLPIFSFAMIDDPLNEAGVLSRHCVLYIDKVRSIHITRQAVVAVERDRTLEVCSYPYACYGRDSPNPKFQWQICRLPVENLEQAVLGAIFIVLLGSS